MKYKFLNSALVGLFMSASCIGSIANAGLITDTLNDSYIDATTGLEWMDFGINNHHSYNDVVGLLGTTYAGWSLANESQVLTLWHNAFSGVGSVPDVVNATGSTWVSYKNNDSLNTAFIELFDTMGYGNINWSLGWFEADAGNLSYTYFSNSNPTDQYTRVFGRDNSYHESYRYNSSAHYSTMLVKSPSVSQFSAPPQISTLPETSTLAIFALGIMGFAARRFKK